MKATTNSWHARVYKFISGSNKLPNNLCPYFWEVIGASILFLLYCLIVWPAHAFKRPLDITGKNVGENIFVSIFCYATAVAGSIFVYINYNLFLAMINAYSYNYKFANTAIIVDSIIITTMLILISIVAVKEWWKNYKYRSHAKDAQPKEPGLFMSFIKAKTKKLCPMIEWIDTKNQIQNND